MFIKGLSGQALFWFKMILLKLYSLSWLVQYPVPRTLFLQSAHNTINKEYYLKLQGIFWVPTSLDV